MNDDFAHIVSSYLGDNPSAGDRPAKMAEHFEVGLWTIVRWANGSANPHPLLKEQILRWIAQNR